MKILFSRYILCIFFFILFYFFAPNAKCNEKHKVKYAKTNTNLDQNNVATINSTHKIADKKNSKVNKNTTSVINNNIKNTNSKKKDKIIAKIDVNNTHINNSGKNTNNSNIANTYLNKTNISNNTVNSLTNIAKNKNVNAENTNISDSNIYIKNNHRIKDNINTNGIVNTADKVIIENDKKQNTIAELIDYFDTKIYDNINNNSSQDKIIDNFNDKNVTETYAGMVGDKRTGNSLNLDLTLERAGSSSLLLVINGDNIDNEKVLKSHLDLNPIRYIIDVNNSNLKDKTMNFTYQMPKNIRLRYKQTQNGYTITIDLPIGTKISNSFKKKDEISVKFITLQENLNVNDNLDVNNKNCEEKKLNSTAINGNIDNANNKVYNKSAKIISDEKKSNFVKNDNSQVSYTDNLLSKTNTTNCNNNTTVVVDKLQNIDTKTSFKKIFIKHNKPFIIAIDAGHGGIDPGAIGSRGVFEKTITLMYANRLRDVLQKKGFKVIMTRSTDKTIPLSQRVKIAQDGNADLFISFHADAHKNRNIYGTTVYRLSNLRENHPDWNRFYNKNYLPSRYEKYINDRSVLDILIGLSHQSLSEKASIIVDNVLLSFKKNNICKICRHGQRSLAVLRGLDVTSILIEIGYISNINEEKKMLLAGYIDHFVKQLANVIENTFVNQ